MKNNFRIKLRLLEASIIAASLLIASCNNMPKSANANMSGASVKDSAANARDAKFLAKAALINMEEIRLGELAQQNSTSTDIKKLGEMLQTDHQKSQDELTLLASKKAITLPTVLDDNAQTDLKNLSALSGTEFDKEYTGMMVKGHEDAIALFKLESSDANDADIRQWAGVTLPVLQKHLDMATDCRKKINAAM